MKPYNLQEKRIIEWLKDNYSSLYECSGKLQSFVNFYQMFCEFDHLAPKCDESHKCIDEEIAEKSAFLTRILSQKEINELLQKIESKEIEILYAMYPVSIIKESTVIPFHDINFVVKKSDIVNFSKEHYETLDCLAATEELVNPVFVSIDADGRLIID